MAHDARNIYQIARKTAGLTQEAAAERLALSVESLRAYETGQRIPGNDVVSMMMSVYSAQYLGIQHVQAAGAPLPACVQDVQVGQSLETSTLKLVNRWLAFANRHRCDQLLAIAEDGVIDEQVRRDRGRAVGAGAGHAGPDVHRGGVICGAGTADACIE